MKVFMDVLFLLIILYFISKFLYVVYKLREQKQMILPVTEEETQMIRKHPDKTVDLPDIPSQKFGIVFYGALLGVILIVFILALIFGIDNWAIYWFLILPITYSHDVLNLFAVKEDGILHSNRFIKWSKITSFQFIPIDISHKYYGFSKEANEGWELKVKTRGFPISCVITTEEMKERIEQLLLEQTTEFQCEENAKE